MARILQIKYNELYQIIVEQDSLMASLDDSDQTSTSPTKPPSSLPQASSPLSTPTKHLNSAPITAETISELKSTTKTVRKWIHHLVDELENSTIQIKSLQDENAELKAEVERLKKAAAKAEMKPEQTLNIADLPPLEHPTLLY